MKDILFVLLFLTFVAGWPWSLLWIGFALVLGQLHVYTIRHSKD